jgi:hypothetical protein
VVWVLAPGQEAPQDGHPVLTRPLQLEAFYEVLQVLGAARPAAPILAEPAPSQTLTRYRLQRWPSSQLLSQHPQGARLASFFIGALPQCHRAGSVEPCAIGSLCAVHPCHAAQQTGGSANAVSRHRDARRAHARPQSPGLDRPVTPQTSTYRHTSANRLG